MKHQSAETSPIVDKIDSRFGSGVEVVSWVLLELTIGCCHQYGDASAAHPRYLPQQDIPFMELVPEEYSQA